MPSPRELTLDFETIIPRTYVHVRVFWRPDLRAYHAAIYMQEWTKESLLPLSFPPQTFVLGPANRFNFAQLCKHRDQFCASPEFAQALSTVLERAQLTLSSQGKAHLHALQQLP